jgi:ABC-type nitrate/sulfonate/bicarbonate transport system substrate-binding protein
MALIMVAHDEHFFSREGLDVELKGFSAGKFALQAFLAGSLDFAVAGDVPVTLSALQGNKFTVLTQVVERTRREVRVVAKRDDSAVPNDPRRYFLAKRRKLATSIGGGPEFFTHVFLATYQIPEHEVDIISQTPQDMPSALSSGSVDAIAVFDPFAFIAERALGDAGLTFDDPAAYSELYLLAASEDTLRTRRSMIDAVLKALVAARTFIDSHPAESKAIVARYTKLDASILDGIWNNFTFAAALTPELLQVLQSETEWARRRGIVAADSPVSDLRKYIADEPLRRIDAAAVRIR